MYFYLTKTFTFDSAHRIEGYSGACRRMHGHTYKIEVTLKAIRLNDLGIGIDFKKLSEVCKKEIIEKYDHQILNNIFPFGAKGLNPTAENMSIAFYKILKEKLETPDVVMYSVKVWETPTSCCEYKE